MKSCGRIFILFALVFVAGCTLYRMVEFNTKYGPSQIVDRQVEKVPSGYISFYDDIQPIVEKRCDVCHGCYDAPCQLKMTCFEGIDRGGSKKRVYDASRILAAAPTRLFIDAETTEAWRQLNFHPVLNERNQEPDANIENSVLYQMLQLKQDNPLPTEGLLPETFDLNLDHNYICPTAEEFSDFKKKYPLWGMPYALPGLTENEHETFIKWIGQGAQILPREGISGRAAQIISQWETFLNGKSLKQQLMSRYLYEHLFIGRMHFEGLPNREFYRLVRSETPPGEPLMEINTVRPYDDPGVEKFYYRFRRIETTIVAKDHTVYYLSPKKMERYRELFLKNNYTVVRLPSYDPESTANPFKTFAAIPAKARYQFMLDDASFFVMGFIKGPVCRGQVALNVINDHFFVAFMDPDTDPISTDTGFLLDVSDYLSIPSEKESNVRIISVWLRYRDLLKKYLDIRNQYMTELEPTGKGRGIEAVWDGDEVNDNALLTVFRHFDSATVVKGFVGQMPKTAWVIDYPLFERIHYLLVAGFNVFGNLGHQAETRIYMDYLRMEGESNFLTFLPKDKRQEIWDGWYEGAREESKNFLSNEFSGLERETTIEFFTNDPKSEFFQNMIDHVGPATAQYDLLNRCDDDNCIDIMAGPLEQAADRHMRRVTRIPGNQLKPLPDVEFLRVVLDGREKDIVYSLIRNKALSNNSMMFREDRRRNPENDTITVVKGYVGTYPNSIVKVPIEKLTSLIDEYLKITDTVSHFNLAQKYRIQRNNPDFWKEADWHYQNFLEQEPIEGGLFDFYRYHRLGEKSNGKKIEW